MTLKSERLMPGGGSDCGAVGETGDRIQDAVKSWFPVCLSFR